MKDWGDLKFILALSRAGTMRAAGETLGTNAATVSRRIDRLTQQAGRQLFKKERDGWRPTGEAERLIALAERIETEMASFEQALERPDHELHGRVTVGSYQGISSFTLVPKLGQFHARYPNLELDFEYGGSWSLAHGEIDLAIRLQRPSEGRLISKRIGWRVSAYYRRRGASRDAGWIGLSREYDKLPMMQQGLAYFGGPPAFRLGALAEIERTILASDMAGPLITCSARLHKELERVDHEALCSIAPVYLLFHESRRKDPVLQTVKQWVESCFAGRGNCCCGKCDIAELGLSDRI